MDEKWYLEKIKELEDSVGKLIKINGTLWDRILGLGGELIDLKRFYLAFKISQCGECNVQVINWESPIIFTTLNSNRDSICNKHQKELDEFNRKYASLTCIEETVLAKTQLRLPTKEEIVIIPTIKLLKGRFRKKSVEIRLVYAAVFTFYDSISIEDYNSIFVKKILESKIDKNKLEVDGLTVNYSVSPNVKTAFPVVLEAEYGSRILEEEEVLSASTRIDQIRVLIFPIQTQEMSLDGLEGFAKAFDNFIEKTEVCLRREKDLPLNMVIKHLILASENVEFLENASKTANDEDFRVNRTNTKVTVTYTRLEKLLTFIRNLW